MSIERVGIVGWRGMVGRIEPGEPETYLFRDADGGEYRLVDPLGAPVPAMGRDFWDHFYVLYTMDVRYREDVDGRRIIDEIYRYDAKRP